MAPISAMLAATNANKIAGLDAYYTSDAVVVDEFAPYEWRGGTAGTQWWTGVQKESAKMHATSVVATAQTVEHYAVAGDAAYVVVPLKISIELAGKTGLETGLLTVTLRRSGGRWKIVTQTWGTSTSTL
jgi:ketosteroid isomerase-like protein